MKKILIVDDAEFMRMTIRNILEPKGYDVVSEAESIEEALKKYQQFKPDLVTMDIVILGGNGIKAVKKILRFDSLAKILMISALGQQELIIDAIHAGAKGFVIKPFKPEQILAEVKRIIG
ncbi:MAG: response regulator [Candidatus Margulisiibacteriota bacterium]